VGRGRPGGRETLAFFSGGIPLSPRGTPALPQPALIFLLFDPPRTHCLHSLFCSQKMNSIMTSSSVGSLGTAAEVGRHRYGRIGKRCLSLSIGVCFWRYFYRRFFFCG
jgi:hypothetical protein